MAETSGNIAAGYKEKYLNALDQQERLEKQHAFQLDLMRKTLIHVSAAAAGLDSHLDASLTLLKDKMRGASGTEVVAQMELVQKAVVEFERNRSAESAAAAAKLRSAIDQFLVLRMPGRVEKSLRQFSKDINKKLTGYRVYPELIEELVQLQRSALRAATAPPQSLWQRLRGGDQLLSKSSSGANPSLHSGQSAVSDSKAGAVSAKGGQALTGELLDEGTDEGLVNLSSTRLRQLAEGVEHGSLLDEDSYQQVAARIELTLRNLIEKIEPNEVVKHKVDIVRLRIERGMDWYVLAVTLEDIRDILMQRYLEVDREFSNYLQQVNEELHAIGEVLGIALERESDQQTAASDFTNAVTDHVKSIQSSMAKSNSLDNLKQAVTNHLSVIQDALLDFQQAQQKHAEQSLAIQLKGLVGRIKSIEQESTKTKALLEAERHRATHDTLTTLANREAYNERAFQELSRFQRYSRPLALAVCDIDHFKKINDNYGHQAGDKVLKLIAKLISTRLRTVDFVARYGGEEFVILMPETDAQQALIVLEKIRKAIAEASFRFHENPVQITISFGIAAFVPEDTVESAFARADRALYQAKDNGRNCCVVADNSHPRA